MEKKVSGRISFLSDVARLFRGFAISVVCMMTVVSTAFGQQTAITGTVTSTGGAPLPGVTVRVQGTDVRAITDQAGRYRVNATPDAVLTFSLVGQRQVQTTVAGRNTVDVTMAQIPYLEEVVVTAYTEQRRGDITGAVSSVNVESAQKQTGASVLQRLDATVPGVTVVASGNPGSRSTVRIRGVSSFQNNDPLYVIDGTPVQDSYLNFLNPDDITSVQVLKDASASSIYGSRASNGVILIETTKRGVAGPPKVQLRARTGVASPIRGYDDFLITNSLDYFKVVKASYENAGLKVPTNIYGDPNNPSVPAYIYAGGAATDAFGRPINVDVSSYSYPNNLIMPGSAGTNWWKEVFRSAPVQDYNLDVNGGGEDNAYRVSFNYFDQQGTARYNDYRRGSVRVNTSFNRSKFNIGENVAIGVDRQQGGIGDDSFGEGAFLGKNILLQPVIPVYDVGGHFASAKATTLGNSSNPLGYAYNARNNFAKNINAFGNVFAGYDATTQLSLKSRLGFNVGQNSWSGFSPATPENAEPNASTSIDENTNNFYDWTWSNTARYVKALGRHNFDFLVGQEANANNNRFISGHLGNLLSPNNVDARYIQDALGDPATKNVSSSGGKSALLSLFTKADYNFADKYVASVTVRRDGSSRLGPGHRWGTFPAFGLGWHLTNEAFFPANRFFSDVMLRYGVGTTGNQLIPSGRIVSQFGGSRGNTFYDITGSGSSVAAGFTQTSLGNPDLKWETNRSQNIGADMVLLNGALNFVIDVYRRNTDNLLFDPALPATAGSAQPPIINVGKMKNTGFDFSLGHQGSWWNATFNGSHYKNTIVSINGAQDFFYGVGTQGERFGNMVINQVGHPIGSFYGYVADGFFADAADVAAHAAQDGAQPGRIKFRDLNDDGVIDSNDRTIIGSPHPKFTAGLDLGARRGNFDVSATLFGSYGNKIFESQMQFYVFREFEANVRQDLLENSWTPTNQNAKYPRLDVSDLFSRANSSFYVKDGSYTRLRNAQIGYTLPSSARYLPGARVYLQGDNLFTHTNYEGLDPVLPTRNSNSAAGDTRDQVRGIDFGTYPTSRVFSVGITTSF